MMKVMLPSLPHFSVFYVLFLAAVFLVAILTIGPPETRAAMREFLASNIAALIVLFISGIVVYYIVKVWSER